jgi:hypothetical protein
MLAYVFWHTPLASLDAREYETPLLAFHADLAKNPSTGACNIGDVSRLRATVAQWEDGL